jgi:hypothetical protein
MTNPNSLDCADSGVCKHGHLARKCEMCENENLQSQLTASNARLEEAEKVNHDAEWALEEIAEIPFKSGELCAEIARNYFLDKEKKHEMPTV